MLTFQILDAGQTFYSPLVGRSISIGSDPTADIRLTEAGVAPFHARVVPLAQKAGDEQAYKIVDLDTETGTRVNGESIAQARLALGDRIELGDAVLVLGQQVRRRATPSDVLHDGGPRALAARRRPRHSSSSARWIAATVAIGLLGILGVVYLSGDDQPPLAYEEQATLRKAGRFDEAQNVLTRLRGDWAGSDASRSALLDGAEGRLGDTREATDELRSVMAAKASSLTYAQQMRELKTLAAEPSGGRAEAARILRGELTELRTAALAALAENRSVAPTPAPPPPDVSTARAEREAPTADAPAAEAPAAGAPAAAPALDSRIASELDGLVASALDAATRLAADGQHAQAIEILSEALATATAGQAPSLRERMAAQRALTRADSNRLVAEARQYAGRGEIDAALALLREHAPRFPSTGSLAGIATEIEDLELALRARAAADAAREAAARSEPDTPRASASSFQQVAGVMDQVRAAERDGDFDRAEVLLREAAGTVQDRDPVFAHRLNGKADDAHHLAELTKLVQRRVLADRHPDLELRDGAIGRLQAVQSHVLQVSTVQGTQELRWPDLPATTVRDLVSDLSGGPQAYLGAAVLAYRDGQQKLAEACLAHALRTDAKLKPAVWGVLRRGRTERPDPKGYRLVGGVFVGMREIEAQGLARKYERRVAKALSGTPEDLEKLVDEMLSEGPRAADALVIALESQRDEIVAKIDKHAFKRKVYDRLADQRTVLDQAREHAKELIYDEEKYFYPFKPPAVEPDKASEYWSVQAEVKKRTDAVRDLWGVRSVRGRVPPDLLEEARRFQRASEALAQFGARDPAVVERIGWVSSLPASGEMNLQNFCMTAAERQAFELYARIEEFNRIVTAELPKAEQRQIEVTNEYRRLFGHRPLAVNLKICAAARGHSEEMAKLGYFGHVSPTPGRRTFIDRMKLSGYQKGTSENCALNGSAVGAHNAWLKSSGHHRNLLRASHVEFGVGNSGKYWTQNFGHGDEFAQNVAFPAVGQSNK